MIFSVSPRPYISASRRNVSQLTMANAGREYMVTTLKRYSEFEPRPLQKLFGAELSPILVAIFVNRIVNSE